MQDKKLHINNNATWRGGWKTGASVLFESFGYDQDLYADYVLEGDRPGEYLPFVGVPRLENLDLVLSLTTPEFKHFSGYVNALWGKDENFYEWSSANIAYVTVQLDWRPTEKLRLNTTYNLQQFKRRSDGSLVGQAPDSAAETGIPGDPRHLRPRDRPVRRPVSGRPAGRLKDGTADLHLRLRHRRVHADARAAQERASPRGRSSPGSRLPAPCSSPATEAP